MKHTPGPWRYSYRDWRNEPSKKAYISGDRYRDQDVLVSTGVAIVEGNASSPKTTEANARLIAAAPDLLAAAREARGYLEAALGNQILSRPYPTELGIYECGEVEYHALCAAIAKAEGQMPCDA